MVKTAYHTLAPVYNLASQVLILGTMPSPKSREAGFYYGHPQNRFWPVLAEVLGTPVPQGAPQRRAFLLEHHIALWDVLACCDIAGANDSSIRNPVSNSFGPIFAEAHIQQVFTTGLVATGLWRRLCLPTTGRDVICLPSPSPANCRMPVGELAAHYRILLSFLA